MTKTIPATKLSEELDNLLNEVQVGRADVVIERDGVLPQFFLPRLGESIADQPSSDQLSPKSNERFWTV